MFVEYISLIGRCEKGDK